MLINYTEKKQEKVYFNSIKITSGNGVSVTKKKGFDIEFLIVDVVQVKIERCRYLLPVVLQTPRLREVISFGMTTADYVIYYQGKQNGGSL